MSNPVKRADYFKHKPDLINQLRALTKSQESFTLDPKLRALVETRVSQINQCAYCVDLHSQEARKLNETQQRLDGLTVWHDSPFFDSREKAALAWAESLTLISETHAPDPVYAELQKHFTENEIVELGLSISLANFWNRMASGFRKIPVRRD